MSQLLKWIIGVCLPLLAGCAVYLLLRSIKPALFTVERWPATVWTPPAHSPAAILLGALPGTLWTFSLTMALLLIWRKENMRAKMVIGSIASGVAVLFEVSQFFGLVAGTFDGWDIVFSILAAVFAVLLYRR